MSPFVFLPSVRSVHKTHSELWSLLSDGEFVLFELWRRFEIVKSPVAVYAGKKGGLKEGRNGPRKEGVR